MRTEERTAGSAPDEWPGTTGRGVMSKTPVLRPLQRRETGLPLTHPAFSSELLHPRRVVHTSRCLGCRVGVSECGGISKAAPSLMAQWVGGLPGRTTSTYLLFPQRLSEKLPPPGGAIGPRISMTCAERKTAATVLSSLGPSQVWW